MSTVNRARAVLALTILMVLGLWSAHHGLTPVALADATEIGIVGHIGGASLTVDVQGDYAYVGEGTQLTILDVSNPAAPVVAGKSPVFLDVVQDVTVEGNYAYVSLGYEGIAILNITDPSAPIIVGTLAMPLYSHAGDTVVAGQYAYVYDNSEGLLMIIDVANPAAPSHTGSIYLGGDIRGLSVAGGYAYMITPDSLIFIDVADPENPFVAHEYELAVVWGWSEAEDMVVAGGYAYILTTTNLVRVLDITNPGSPIEGGIADIFQYSLKITVAGEYAYVVDYWGGLTTVDISDPANPAVTGYLTPRQDLPDGGSGLVVAGDLAFFNDPYGMRIADISDPNNPVQTSTYDTLRIPTGLTAVDDYVYVTDGVHGLIIIDAANPAHPIRVGSYDTPGYAREIVVSGDYAYIADGSADLQIIDVADPAAPAAVGSLSWPGETMSLDVEGNYAYVTAYDSGQFYLRVIDISDPANPVQVGSLPTPGNSWNVDVVGRYAYVVDANNLGGFVIVDVSNPAGPVQVGSYGGNDVYFHVSSMKVVGDLAYLAADYYGGLRIVNVADPTAPVDVGSYDTPGEARDLAVSGPYVYMADDRGGLRIFDVTDPALPVEVAYNDTIIAYNVVLAGDHAFVLHDWSGLYILETPESDNDGQPDEIEDGAPNNGDGNNDGIPDSQQANVVSLPNNENGGYVTLEAPAGIELVDVQATANPSPGDTPAGAVFPVGFLDFRIEGISPGEAVAVTIILHGGETVDSYYKYGPEPGDPADHWYAFDYDGTTGAEFPAGQIVLHLVDGGRGDSDLTADGVIVDPGAPALAPPVAGVLYVSGLSSGTAGGVKFDNRDIMAFDIATQTWATQFDGSDVGGKPISAFSILDDDSLVIAFKSLQYLPGLGIVMPHDLVRFVPVSLGSTTGGAFEWYLDGSDVGLTMLGERIDAVDVLPDGRILISPTGAARVGPGNSIAAASRDLLALTPTNTGSNSAGVWAKYFDGSTVTGLASEDVVGVEIDVTSGDLYLIIANGFNIGGVIGGPNDVLRLEPDSGGGFTVHHFWNGPANGFLPKLRGIELGD